MQKKYKILMVDQTHTLAMDYMALSKINSKRFSKFSCPMYDLMIDQTPINAFYDVIKS